MNVIVKGSKSITKQLEEDGTEREYECIVNGESVFVRAVTHTKAMETAKSIVKKRDAMKAAKTKK